PVAPSKPVPIARVSAPTFYNFKADSLVGIDLAALNSSLPQAGKDGTEPSDSAFREAVATAIELELRAEKPIADAILAYYANKPDFIWLDASGLTERARVVMDVLNDAEAFGLTAADYSVNRPFFPAATGEEAKNRRLKAMLRFELTLTARALRYARDAHMGRLDPNKLSGFHDFAPKKMEEGRVLDILASTATPDRYLKALHPQNEAFASLKDELAILRAATKDEIAVDPHLLLKP